MCSKKEHGGLGVRKLKEFNVVLLGKWCWRMLVDREGLWYNVLVARYGELGGRLEVGGGVLLRGGGRYVGFVMGTVTQVEGGSVIVLDGGWVMVHRFVCDFLVYLT